MKIRSHLACLTLLSCAALAPAADAPVLRGYAPESARAERDWEVKFRAIPSPQNLRAYMQRLSARPHHVGSPYDKDNAEWMLAKFKEWGLDAQIETFDVLFPTPKERVARTGGARRISRPSCRSRPWPAIPPPPARRAVADL